MQDGFREHQVLKKVLIVELPCHLELLQMFVLLKRKNRASLKRIIIIHTHVHVCMYNTVASTHQGEEEAADGAGRLAKRIVLL